LAPNSCSLTDHGLFNPPIVASRDAVALTTTLAPC
jgi:hypothetical protein